MKKLLFVTTCLIATLSLAAQTPLKLVPGQRVISLDAATATGAGAVYYFDLQPGGKPPITVTWQLNASGAPTSAVFALEGSNDLVIRNDGVATAASATFTSATGNFQARDIGKEIVVVGAGAAGVNLVTTISAVASTTSITLGASASTSVSAARFRVARWFTLDTYSAVTTDNQMRHYTNKALLYIRGNVTTLTGGASPTVTVEFLGAAQ